METCRSRIFETTTKIEIGLDDYNKSKAALIQYVIIFILIKIFSKYFYSA